MSSSEKRDVRWSRRQVLAASLACHGLFHLGMLAWARQGPWTHSHLIGSFHRRFWLWGWAGAVLPGLLLALGTLGVGPCRRPVAAPLVWLDWCWPPLALGLFGHACAAREAAWRGRTGADALVLLHDELSELGSAAVPWRALAYLTGSAALALALGGELGSTANPGGLPRVGQGLALTLAVGACLVVLSYATGG